MDNYVGTKELAAQMEKGLQTFMDMMGPVSADRKGTYQFVPGLGLTQHSRMLQSYSDKLREGVFQLMFTGCFSCGKSTIINALMRRPILRMAINPETAVITKIVFGDKEKAVLTMREVDHSSGEAIQKEMTLDEFFELARVSQEDPDKFKNVSHAVIYLDQEGIGGRMVQFVDSPGTQNSQADSEVARAFIKQANAIVYMINATTPFVQEDKEYIATHFAGRQMQNLFFVINRIDGVNDEELEGLKRNVRKQLTGVFARADGSFDEQLFQKRVFYTNAYGALQTRQGLPAARFMGQAIYVKDEDTGVPQFEAALAEFLTSDGRDKAAFQAYMPRLAGMYAAAEDEIEKILARYREDVGKLESDQKKIKANEEKYRRVLQAIVDSCKNTVRGILEDARREYQSTVNRINAGWNKHFKDADVKFGFGQMASMIGNKVQSLFNEEKAKANFEKLMKPFSDAVKAYVDQEMGKMEGAIERSLNLRMAELEQAIKQQTALLDALDLPISTEDIVASLAHAFHIDVDTQGGMKNNTKLFQVFAGIVAMDPAMIGKGTTGGNTARMLGELLLKEAVEFVAWFVVAWPLGIAMLVARLIQIIREGNASRSDSAMKMLDGMRETVVSNLMRNEDQYVTGLEGKLAVILRAGTTMTQGIQSVIQDYEKQIAGAIQALKANKDAADGEEKRTAAVRKTLLDTFNSLSQALYGKKMTAEEIRKLAVPEE